MNRKDIPLFLTLISKYRRCAQNGIIVSPGGEAKTDGLHAYSILHNVYLKIPVTYCINPDIKKLRLIRLIKSAKKLAEKNIRPGVSCFKVDMIVRNYLKTKTRYRFPYSLGHGVKARIHQKPKINPRSKDIFKVGDIFTLEPGLHGSFGGIRIEDMYILTKKGLKNLTKDI